jgi:DNA polymerase elongation subunit (family B)
VFYDSKEEQTELLNSLIQQWTKEKYGKSRVSIEFAHEGTFEKLFLIAKCRYVGYINGEIETKGVESKRKDSTVFIKSFQQELISKILDKRPKNEIYQWIKEQLNNIQKCKLNEIAFPCKLARKPEDYKNTPIFVRALHNTPNFDKKVGNPFYYIFMQGKDETKKQLVLAFDEEHQNHIDRSQIDWKQIKNRNVLMKLDTLFNALGWDIKDFTLKGGLKND